MGFPGGSDSNQGSGFNPEQAQGSIPGLERYSGGGHGNPLPVFLPGESPWSEEPGRLQSMGSQTVRHDGVTKHT